MEVDYIVVGAGLAGVHFCELLEKKNLSFVVFNNNSQQSSVVAGGMYNAVILKRFTLAWKSSEQLKILPEVYESLEQKLQVKINYATRIRRLFSSVEEQNNWLSASDKILLEPYLNTSFIPNTNSFIKAPFGFGEIKHTGRIDSETLIYSYQKHLKETGKLITNTFLYQKLQITEEGVLYEGIRAKKIVFAEGFGLKKNPFFNNLPLDGTKGEVLTIHAPNLKIDYILKAKSFLIPLENNLYKLGATYDWNDKTNAVTQEAHKNLLDNLHSFYTGTYTVEAHEAGMRPTVKDRRPLVGRHSKYKNMYVLNGLGTRGVMIAPYIAKDLFNFTEQKKPLNIEIDCNRFTR